MPDKEKTRGRRPLKFVILLLLFNVALGGLLYLEITDVEELDPVKGLSMTKGDPRFDTIDPADSVLVTPYPSNDSVVTAYNAREVEMGYWGDVAVFESDGDPDVRIVHRVLFYLRFNLSKARIKDIRSVSVDVPELNMYGVKEITVRSRSAYYNLTAPELVRPFLVESELTKESLEELRAGAGYVTIGDHNTKVDQEHMRPVKFEWFLGRAEVVDNPFGTHTPTSMYLLTVFVVIFFGLNLWGYRTMFERGGSVDMKVFNVFFVVFISLYCSGFFIHLFSSRFEGPALLLPVLAEALFGLATALIWIKLRPLEKGILSVRTKGDGTILHTITSRRHCGVFQGAAGIVLAYGAMKLGLYIFAQVVIFVLFMSVLYGLSIPRYMKGIPLRPLSKRRNAKRAVKAVPSRRREHKLLDWMILSMLMVLILLIHSVEGLSFEIMLILGAVFGDLMIVNYSVDASVAGVSG